MGIRALGLVELRARASVFLGFTEFVLSGSIKAPSLVIIRFLARILAEKL